MSENKKNSESLQILKPDDEIRLDQFLVARFPSYSRMFFKKLINTRHILVDQHPASAHHKLRRGQTVAVNWPEKKTPLPFDVSGPVPFPILFEDDELLVIDKPAGLLVHPVSDRFKDETLVDLLGPRIARDEWPEGVRPGLVHRLDRETSGLILFAKTPQAHTHLSKQFSNRHVKKTYFALVQGKLDSKKGILESHLARDPFQRKKFRVAAAGRLAVTNFEVIENYNGRVSLVKLNLLTGRTHQLRVQLAHFGHPILGDKSYGHLDQAYNFVKRHLLHAAGIVFQHPRTKKEMKFESPLPSDFQEAIKIIRSSS